MEFLEKVAAFADQLTSAENEQEQEALLKVASDMDVGYEDVVAFHNILEGNIFTGENLVKVAEEIEPSRIAYVGDLWEKLATGEVGPEAVEVYSEELGLSPEETVFILDQLDKKAEEAGLFAEPADQFIDEVAIEKVAEAYEYLAESGIDPMAAMDFAVEMLNAENEEEGEKIASEYEGLDDETLDKVAEVVEYLADVPNAYELMDIYDKEAGKVGDALKAFGGKAKDLGKKYIDALTGGEEGRIARQRIRESKRALKASKKEKGMKAKLKKMFGPGVDWEKVLENDKKAYRPILKKQLLTAGATVGGLGLAGAGAYYATRRRK